MEPTLAYASGISFSMVLGYRHRQFLFSSNVAVSGVETAQFPFNMHGSHGQSDLEG
jgi:hypothetical protein